MVTEIEDAIYQAAFRPEKWSPVLHSIAAAVNAEGALLANVSNPSLPWFASAGVAELYDEFFNQGWAYDNAKTHALLTTPHRGFISDAQYISDEVMSRQGIYRDFLWPKGFGYAAGTLIEDPKSVAIGISIEFKKSRGPASKAELAYLDMIRPHLARAAILAHHLEYAKVEAALQALELANIPAATLAMDGTVLRANKAFETFGDSVTITARDRLILCSGAAKEFYRSLGTSTPRGRTGRSFPLKASETAPAAILHFLPVVGVASEVFLNAGYFVLVTPAERGRAPAAALLRGLFDLTATEARIAEKLALGHVIAEIAASECSSTETVRSHVKSILSKSGVKSQRDFVSAVASIHAIRQF